MAPIFRTANAAPCPRLLDGPPVMAQTDGRVDLIQRQQQRDAKGGGGDARHLDRMGLEKVQCGQ